MEKEIQEGRVAELLKPRYKVIADWPGMKFDVGEILFESYTKGLTNDYIKNGWCDKYPHLFKPLQWWEDRKPEEMPKYLKLKPGQEWVSKPIHYILAYDVICPDKESGTFQPQLENFIPATETEYNNQKGE